MFRLLLQVYSLLPLPSVHELTILYLLVQIYSSLPLPSQMISRSGLKASVHLIPPLVNMIVPPGITRSVFSHGIQVWNYIGEPNVFFSDSCSFSIFILLNCLMNLVIKVSFLSSFHLYTFPNLYANFSSTCIWCHIHSKASTTPEQQPSQEQVVGRLTKLPSCNLWPSPLKGPHSIFLHSGVTQPTPPNK